jgi:hypothetical protein
MFADHKRVARRRLMRRLKAAASIAVALAAGTFLACRRDGHPSTGDVPEPESSADDAPTTSALPPGSSTQPSGSQAASSQASASASASASGKELTVPAPAPPPPTTTPTVDKQQHKKGMPVPDNLLE